LAPSVDKRDILLGDDEVAPGGIGHAMPMRFDVDIHEFFWVL